MTPTEFDYSRGRRRLRRLRACRPPERKTRPSPCACSKPAARTPAPSSTRPLGFAATAPLGIFNWNYESVPQPGLGGRRGFAPRGKVMGGSSSLNAMVYTRGNPHDYDRWAALGNPGWSYQEVLPLFKQSENNQCFGNNEYRSTGGPLNVSYLRSPSPLNQAFLDACESQGLPRTPDYNGAQQWGCAPAQVTRRMASAGVRPRPMSHPTATAPTLP